MREERLAIKIMIVVFLSAAMFLATARENHSSSPPRRVISLAPNLTEIIFKLNADSLLVGRTEFCTFPPAAQKIPSVGGYLNPDYERMVALRPQLVVMLPNAEMAARLQSLNIAVLQLPDETIDEILQSIMRLGEILNRKERAQEVVNGIQDTLNLVQKGAGEQAPVSAMLVVGRQPGSLQGIYVAGRQTYLSEIWEMCGGKNVFADVPLRYFDVDAATVLKSDPEVILEFFPVRNASPGEISHRVEDWATLPGLQAFHHRQIFIFSDRMFLIPGPRISKIALEFHHIIQQVHRP